jgi:hypothetical protein
MGDTVMLRFDRESLLGLADSFGLPFRFQGFSQKVQRYTITRREFGRILFEIHLKWSLRKATQPAVGFPAPRH